MQANSAFRPRNRRKTHCPSVAVFMFSYAAFALSVPDILLQNLSAIQKSLNEQLGLRLVEAKVPVLGQTS